MGKKIVPVVFYQRSSSMWQQTEYSDWWTEHIQEPPDIDIDDV